MSPNQKMNRRAELIRERSSAKTSAHQKLSTAKPGTILATPITNHNNKSEEPKSQKIYRKCYKKQHR